MAEKLTYTEMKATVETGAALRCRRRLQPAGGPGDKVFPPTYEGGKYAEEQRVIDGTRVPCVLLDSVQSQANRIEMAIRDTFYHGKGSACGVPVVTVDFSDAGLPEVREVTSLDAPHRLADAILRDSMLGEVRFRAKPPTPSSEEGKILDTATIENATGLFGLCPTALVFGLWDSTGPRGGLGTKFQRVLVGEVVAIDAMPGARPSSRIDPLGIQLNAGPIYRTPDGDMTLDPALALRKDNKAVLYAKGKKGEDVTYEASGRREVPDEGRPSKANHGNVTPSLKNENGQPHHGGVTMAYALQTVVLSLPALRRLHFPVGGKDSPAADLAARTVLAALGLCGAVLSMEAGCDLRSRCLLVPEPGQAGWEIVAADGTTKAFTLDAKGACALLQEAVAAAVALGLPWRTEPLRLTPSAGLAALVRESRKLAMQSGAEEA